MEPQTAKFKFQVEKIAGKPTSGGVCGVFNKNLSLVDGTTGLLGGCIQVTGEGEDLNGLLHKIFESSCEAIEASEAEILERLKKINVLTQSYVETNSLDFDYIFCFFYKGACYVIRAGEAVGLWVYEQDDTREINIDYGSGLLKEKQIYLIANKDCAELFDFSLLSEPDVNLADVIDGMATEIFAQENALLGAVFVKVSRDDDEVGAKVPVEEKEIMDANNEVAAAEDTGVEDQAEEDASEIGVSDEPVGSVESVTEVAIENEEGQNLAPQKKGRNFLGILSGGIKRILSEIKGVFKGDRVAVGSFRKKLVIGVVVVILILAGSATYTIWQKSNGQKQAEVKFHIDAASAKYNEGVSIIELNKARAKQILIEAQTEVKMALALDSKSAEAKRLEGDIRTKLKETDADGNVELTPFAELSGEVKAIVFNGKNLVAITGSAAFNVDTSGKPTEVVTDLKNVTDATLFDNKLFYTGSDGVFRQAIAGGKAVQVTDFKDAQDIGVFFGNVYLLKFNQVAKLVPIEDGYATATDYLDGTQLFTKNSQMAIDSLIWVTAGENILKYNKGKKIDFTVAGLPGKLGDLGPIFTDGNVQNLYIVDKANSALLIIDKDGNYKKALQASDIGKATSLVVNEAEDTVYLAVEDKILKASLK